MKRYFLTNVRYKGCFRKFKLRLPSENEAALIDKLDFRYISMILSARGVHFYSSVISKYA